MALIRFVIYRIQIYSQILLCSVSCIFVHPFSFTSWKYITVSGPPKRFCVECQSRSTAVSGRQRTTCFSSSCSFPSNASEMNPPIVGICMAPFPDPPTAIRREGCSGCRSIKNARSGVSASQQMRANEKGRSAKCGIVSRRKSLARASASSGT